MPALALEGIGKRFGPVEVVRGVSVEAAEGELLVLVGGSGSGKSTLLRMVAGLETPSEGRILIAGRDVAALPPAARDVAMVFQDYALYPHLTVRENMALGLRLRHLPRAEIARRVGWAAETLGLEPLLGRRPKALSGGQRQRVAMGRAMVREPAVFLFDEPLSNLDAALRGRMRVEIGTLQRRLGTTTLYVTHDQVEAMTLGDRIVVLADGRVQQVGPPMALYDRPANRFVAGFLGTPPMNFVEGAVRRDGGAAAFVAEGIRVPLPAERVAAGAAVAALGVRPEALALAEPGTADAIAGRVALVERLGAVTHVHVDAGPHRVLAVVPHEVAVPAVGEAVGVRVPAERVHLFAADGGAV